MTRLRTSAWEATEYEAGFYKGVSPRMTCVPAIVEYRYPVITFESC